MNILYKVVPSLIGAAMLAACTDAGATASGLTGSPASADTAADPDNIADAAPPIRLEQTAIMLHDGKPLTENNYRFALTNCRAAHEEAVRDGGSLPVKPLSEEVAAKLGRTFFHISYAGRRMAVRTEAWDFTITKGTLCEFQPIHQAELFVDKPGELLSADLIKATATREPSEGVVRYPPEESTADDEANKAKVMALLQAQGFGSAVQIRESEGQVAGQPCHQIENDLIGTTCTWTGGKQWGFVPDTARTPETLGDGVSGSIPGDSILLSAEPPNGTGIKLTTESMMVGGEVDESAFAPPAGLATGNVD